MAHSDQTNKITNSAANVTDFMWPHNNMTFETYSNILLLLVTLLLLSTAVVLYQNITIWGLCPQLWTLGTLPPTFANTIWMSNQSSKFFERGLPQSRTTPDSSHFTLLVMETEDVKVMWMVNEDLCVMINSSVLTQSWQFGLVAMRCSWSTQLRYARPG